MNDKENLPLQQIEIAPLIELDIDELVPILHQHIRDSKTKEVHKDEVKSIVEYMRGKPDEEGRIRNYLVAKDSNGNVIGCMAYTKPERDMEIHLNTNKDESIELMSGFVSQEVYRGGGVGKQLFESACSIAKNMGKKQVVYYSGPRYKKSWGFHDKMADKSAGYMRDKFGEGIHAKTWIKYL